MVGGEGFPLGDQPPGGAHRERLPRGQRGVQQLLTLKIGDHRPGIGPGSDRAPHLLFESRKIVIEQGGRVGQHLSQGINNAKLCVDGCRNRAGRIDEAGALVVTRELRELQNHPDAECGKRDRKRRHDQRKPPKDPQLTQIHPCKHSAPAISP